MNSQGRKVLQDEENSMEGRERGNGKPSVGPSGTRKAQQQQSRFRSLREEGLSGPRSRTRASLKRRNYEPSSIAPEGEKKPNQEDESRKCETGAIVEEQSGAPSITQPLPNKQTLELIIDVLQRKDAYEIFAEPVNPEEVKDYYEIIEEPMDFGTMRAKLHEGWYTSLEQFKHDVFLISENAMHFNSSGTIFFKQAHGIHNLAKRVFHVLKTNPENLESEFKVNKRRSCKRLQGDNGDEKRTDHSIEVDRRSTYKPETDLNNDHWSKTLIYANEEEHTYTQSLLRFVKDLGPTAQMVAKRKLQNLTVDHQTPILDSGKQSQIQSGQMLFNSSPANGIRETGSLGIENPVNRGLDLRSLNGIGGDCDGNMDSNVTSTSLPSWLLEGTYASRIELNMDFLKSKRGK